MADGCPVVNMVGAATGAMGDRPSENGGQGVVSTIRFDLPVPEGDTVEFWEATRRGRLLLKWCGNCGTYSYYPRPFCPECWSEQVTWHEASGDATLYTWSVIYNNDQPPFRDRVPYVAAVVDLAEGPRMVTNVIDTPFEDLSIGMPLRVTYKVISEELTIPVFVRA